MSSLYSLGKQLHTLGVTLIEDDVGDLGYFTYKGRNNHYYHGKKSPDHPSPWHHWQLGSVMIVAGQMLGYYDVFREVASAEAEEAKIQGFFPPVPTF